MKPYKPHNDLTINEKMTIAGIAGGVAAWATTPLSHISIRQILDSQIKMEWRRNYGNTSTGIEMLKKEGSLWKGSWINIIRHVAINISLTGPYDAAR